MHSSKSKEMSLCSILGDAWEIVFDYLPPRNLMMLAQTSKFFAGRIKIYNQTTRISYIPAGYISIEALKNALKVFPNLQLNIRTYNEYNDLHLWAPKNVIGYKMDMEPITKIKGYKNLKYLWNVVLNDKKIDNIKDIKDIISNLNTIQINYSIINDFSFLQNVQHVHLCSCTNLSDMRGLKGKISVIINGCMDISDVSSLSTVKYVVLRNNTYTPDIDATPLKNNHYISIYQNQRINNSWQALLSVKHLSANFGTFGQPILQFNNLEGLCLTNCSIAAVINLIDLTGASKLKTLILKGVCANILGMSSLLKLKVLKLLVDNALFDALPDADIETLYGSPNMIERAVTLPIKLGIISTEIIRRFAIDKSDNPFTFRHRATSNVKYLEITQFDFHESNCLDEFTNVKSIYLNDCKFINNIGQYLANLTSVSVKSMLNYALDIRVLKNVSNICLERIMVREEDIYTLTGCKSLTLSAVRKMPENVDFEICNNIDSCINEFNPADMTLVIDISRLQWLNRLYINTMRVTREENNIIPEYKHSNSVIIKDIALDYYINYTDKEIISHTSLDEYYDV